MDGWTGIGTLRGPRGPKKGAQIDLNLLLGLRRNVSLSTLSHFERAHQPEYER